MNVIVTTSSFGRAGAEPLERLRASGLTVELNPHGRTLTADEARSLARGRAGILAGTEPLTAEVLADLPGLKVISRCGAGLDNVDLAAAAARGIKVFSTPEAPAPAVAELTLALALALLRHVPAHDRDLRQGVWEKRTGSLLAGQNIGVVGFGRVGRRVAGLFQAFGGRVAVYDPLVQTAEFPNPGLEELLAGSRLVTLHCPAPADGRPLLDAERLGLLPRGSRLINTARGRLVDETALHRLLAAGHLAGAALDVFSEEPYHGPLAELDNVILTPHVASLTRETRLAMELEAAENLLAGLGL